MLIFSSPFYTLHSSEKNNKLLIGRYLEETISLTDEAFKEGSLELWALLKEIQPVAFLNDMRQMRYTMAPDIQAWVHENTPYEAFSAMKRNAIILSTDFFSKLSVEQVMEDVKLEDLSFTSRYFDKEEEAMHWLEECL